MATYLAALVLVRLSLGFRPLNQAHDNGASTIHKQLGQMQLSIHVDNTTQSDTQSRRQALAAPTAQNPQKLDPAIGRPTEGKGPTVVLFDITFQSLYSEDITHGTCLCDIVISARWHDGRTENLIPVGEDHITLTEKVAKKTIWLPSLVFGNPSLENTKTISVALTVSRDAGGTVTSVRRVMATLMNKYNLARFPFDQQNLTVKIGSEAYFQDELQLVPADNLLGPSVAPDAFEGKGFHFVSSYVETYTNALKRSIGKLSIRVERDYRPYLSEHFGPTLYLLGMSYFVFWLPVRSSHVVPRLATSTISYLSLTQLMGKYNGELKGAQIKTWGDKFFFLMQTMMFFTLVWTVTLEFIAVVLEASEFAQRMNVEMRIIFPTLLVICLIQCWMSIEGSGGTTAALVLFLCYCQYFFRLVKLGKIPSPWAAEEDVTKVDEEVKADESDQEQTNTSKEDRSK